MMLRTGHRKIFGLHQRQQKRRQAKENHHRSSTAAAAAVALEKDFMGFVGVNNKNDNNKEQRRQHHLVASSCDSFLSSPPNTPFLSSVVSAAESPSPSLLFQSPIVAAVAPSCQHHQHQYIQCRSKSSTSWSSKNSMSNHRQQGGGGSSYGYNNGGGSPGSDSSSVFVSRYNQSLNLTSSSILDYCGNHALNADQAKTNSTHVILRECPFCTKPTNDKMSNLYKLHIKLGDGAYFCHRCGNGGSWYDFKSKLSSGGVTLMNDNSHSHHSSSLSTSSFGDGYGRPSSSNNNSNNEKPMPPVRLSGYYASKLFEYSSTETPNEVLRYLQDVRGLSLKTLRHYGVGRATYQFPTESGKYEPADCITFPWIEKKVVDSNDNGKDNSGGESESGDAAKAGDAQFITKRIKVRAMKQKGWQRLDPPGGSWGLFGLHTVPDDATSIILTEGEYDAMAVYQSTGLPAVSLPNGCRSLPLDVLPLLEKFERIYLWMDNDQAGQEGCEKFAKKLGLGRCYIVQTPHGIKDANEALLKNLESTGDNNKNEVDDDSKNYIDFKDLLDKAKVTSHDRILTFEDLRLEVLSELIEPHKYMGTPIKSLPNFTNLIKGYRKGELSVLTGPTGSGKTTFLGQISIDLAEQGQNVLWGSFEIKNTRLLQKLMKQFSRDALPGPPSKTDTDNNDASSTIEAFEALADRFQSLPLYFMSFHGGSNIDEVLDAMEYAVYVNDVQHIILDNMQFMITRSGNNSRNYNPSFDKFDTQDIAIEKFRKFATEHNIHITLVVHPRKGDDSQQLDISSFYGSAKATQEADTVLILQSCDNGRRKYIDVRKNRFDGTLGMSPLYFQPTTGRYSETETPIPLSSTSPPTPPKRQPGGSSPPLPPPSGNNIAPAAPQQRQPLASAAAGTKAQTFFAANRNAATPMMFNAPGRKQQWQQQRAKQKKVEYDDLDSHWRDCLAPTTPSFDESSSSSLMVPSKVSSVSS